MPTRVARLRIASLPGLAFVVLVLVFASASAQARDVRIVSITENPVMPVIRPDTPVPDDPGQVLYLQRSTNRNTVVYAANFDPAGMLDPRDPVGVYWRRYEEQGQTRALTLLERQIAYGVRARLGPEPGSFRVNFRAVPGLEMTLRQSAPFQAALYAVQGDVSLRLVYGHIEAIDGLIPQVVEVVFFGTLANGRHATVVLAPE